jgi:subtilase family serine protease
MEPGPTPEGARYVVTLRNTGRQAAGEFDAIVYVDGTREGSVLVPDLAAHGRQAITVEGQRCGLGSSVLVVLDSDDRVDESRETNNTTRFACPL